MMGNGECAIEVTVEKLFGRDRGVKFHRTVRGRGVE